MQSNPPETRAPGPRPFWIPENVKFDELPPPLQYALTEIVGPAYQELVVGAQTGLEQSMGATYVQTLWLSLVEGLALNRAFAPDLARGKGLERHEKTLARYLRLVGAKDKIAKFLLDVQKFYDRGGEKDALGGPR